MTAGAVQSVYHAPATASGTRSEKREGAVNSIAGALIVREPYDFRIVQKSGTATPVNTEDVAIESRTGRGQPYVVVVMDDVVTELVKADCTRDA